MTGTSDAFALAPTADGHMIVGTQNTLIDIEMDPEAVEQDGLPDGWPKAKHP